MLRLRRNKSAPQFYDVNNQLNLTESELEPQENLQSQSTEASNDNHMRNLSTLSTTPLILEEDVNDFLMDLSQNSKPAAFLEKERTSVQEMKVMEEELRKGLERLRRNSTILCDEEDAQAEIIVQLDDHDLMNITKTQSQSNIYRPPTKPQLSTIPSSTSLNAVFDNDGYTKTNHIPKHKSEKMLYRRYFSLQKNSSLPSIFNNEPSS